MPQDPIKHVIVLMLENRSFDHLLGDCPKMRARYAMNGSNSAAGKTVSQAAGASRTLTNDPQHDTANVLFQLGLRGGAGTNGGFLQDYANAYHTWPGNQTPSEIMKYHAAGTMPALHGLAEAFTICENWFASVPGPTWPNRLFALSGTSLGKVQMPDGLLHLNLHWYEQSTVFDRLNEKKVAWKVYFGDTPLSFLFVHQWEPENAARHYHMTQFFTDAAGTEADFPAFAFIEPAYMQPGANDAHPPHDILAADLLIASVYDAIRANDPLWQSSLLVVLCDEHGGFYDHVPAPIAVPPDQHQEEYSFDNYGVRVPALLISPYAPNDVFSEVLDHTSLLRYLQLKWQLGDLGARTAQAKSFDGLFLKTARSDTPPQAQRPAAQVMLQPLAPQNLTDHQTALVALSHGLEAMAGEDPNVVAARNRHALSGPQAQIDAVVDRVDSFIAARRKLV